MGAEEARRLMQSGFRSYAGWEPLHVECETHLRPVKPLEKRRMNMNRLFLVMVLLGGFVATALERIKSPLTTTAD